MDLVVWRGGGRDGEAPDGRAVAGVSEAGEDSLAASSGHGETVLGGHDRQAPTPGELRSRRRRPHENLAGADAAGEKRGDAQTARGADRRPIRELELLAWRAGRVLPGDADARPELVQRRDAGADPVAGARVDGLDDEE